VEACEWEREIVMPVVDGAALNVGQAREQRAPITCRAPNLFFAGDTTAAPGAGADIAFDSALRCAELVERRIG